MRIAYEEILFWRDNIDELNTNIDANDLHYKFEVHSDASNNAVGVMVGNGMSCHKNLGERVRLKSSTWREIATILYGLEVFEELFTGKRFPGTPTITQPR